MTTDMKETFKSEFASMRQDIKDIVGKVELVEAHNDLRKYMCQLHQHALDQTLRESHCHLEDLDNRRR